MSNNHTAQIKARCDFFIFMNNFFKKLLILLLVTTSYLILSPSLSYAGFSCQPIYGGGQTCVSIGGVAVNKTVINPQTGKMVDSLGINDPKFSAEYIVTFQIALTNTGDSQIGHIDVRDVLPQFVNFNAGPGNFDPNNKTLTFGVDNLAPNETRVFTLVGKVVEISKLPQNVVCVVNQVTAATKEEQISQDNSQFCIEKKVPVTKGGFPVFPAPTITITPPTGPESLALFSLVPTGVLGWFLRKKSHRKS